MKIAIIGTGNVGRALGTSFAGAGHQVVFSGRDLAKTAEAAGAIGAWRPARPRRPPRGADVVVLAVPYGAAASVAAEIAPVVAGKVVIDATNPLKPDYSGLATGDGPSGAELLAAALPGARVVKAFNTLFATNQGNPAPRARPSTPSTPTDDAEGRTTSPASSSIGFRPVHVGPLAAARELEAMAWLNIRLQLLTNGSWQTAYVLIAPPEAAKAA